jgi:hypothetical protein
MNKLIYAIGIVVATTLTAHPKTEKVNIEHPDSVKIEASDHLTKTISDTLTTIAL